MGPGEQELDKIQRIAARVVATNAAGHKLLLIGGFRYRLLDSSSRFSRDIHRILRPLSAKLGDAGAR